MNDEIERFEQRLRKIEDDLTSDRATRAANRRWATAAGLLCLAWLGITSFWQIPVAIQQSNTGKLAHEAEDARDRAVSAAKDITSVAERVNAGRLRFTTACKDLERDGCKAPVPPCPAGFVDAGFQESDTWTGGDCGHGHVCRVCYKFENK
jgi:hypothetical protein